METKKTIIETTTQVTTDNAIYDITTSKVDGVITSIKADVMAQIREKDELGGYTLSATKGTISQGEKGITINGTIPTDMLPTIISEFNEIVNEFKEMSKNGI